MTHYHYCEPHRWFAWHPIRLEGRWTWLRTVVRSGHVFNGIGRWYYEEPKP
jgi:hypothetical protein